MRVPTCRFSVPIVFFVSLSLLAAPACRKRTFGEDTSISSQEDAGSKKRRSFIDNVKFLGFLFGSEAAKVVSAGALATLIPLSSVEIALKTTAPEILYEIPPTSEISNQNFSSQKTSAEISEMIKNAPRSFHVVYDQKGIRHYHRVDGFVKETRPAWKINIYNTAKEIYSPLIIADAFLFAGLLGYITFKEPKYRSQKEIEQFWKSNEGDAPLKLASKQLEKFFKLPTQDLNAEALKKIRSDLENALASPAAGILKSRIMDPKDLIKFNFRDPDYKTHQGYEIEISETSKASETYSFIVALPTQNSNKPFEGDEKKSDAKGYLLNSENKLIAQAIFEDDVDPSAPPIIALSTVNSDRPIPDNELLTDLMTFTLKRAVESKN